MSTGKHKMFICYASFETETESIAFSDFIIRIKNIFKDKFELLFDENFQSNNIHADCLNWANACDIALIIVSPRLILRDSYANTHEIPALSARKNTKVILPLLFEYCNFKEWNKENEFPFFQFKFDNPNLLHTKKSVGMNEFAPYSAIDKGDWAAFISVLQDTVIERMTEKYSSPSIEESLPDFLKKAKQVVDTPDNIKQAILFLKNINDNYCLIKYEWNDKVKRTAFLTKIETQISPYPIYDNFKNFIQVNDDDSENYKYLIIYFRLLLDASMLSFVYKELKKEYHSCNLPIDVLNDMKKIDEYKYAEALHNTVEWHLLYEKHNVKEEEYKRFIKLIMSLLEGNSPDNVSKDIYKKIGDLRMHIISNVINPQKDELNQCIEKSQIKFLNDKEITKFIDELVENIIKLIPNFETELVKNLDALKNSLKLPDLEPQTIKSKITLPNY